MAGKFGAESAQVYSGLATALERLTNEATILSEHSKKVIEHHLVLKNVNKSFNQVQCRLERVAAIRPGFSQVNM
ncbi:hypothetical protein GDO86_004511 [Hymenochirus boettgeri]|uniref:Uncharacterized protein n=1 Tax=Hymenochirus boettgeri TaxID=247094 RepID=A0A8T2KEE6_9PIPI|nr:hypothetical protein GDO86_004511 [Hymenochirus boettgeri]